MCKQNIIYFRLGFKTFSLNVTLRAIFFLTRFYTRNKVKNKLRQRKLNLIASINKDMDNHSYNIVYQNDLKSFAFSPVTSAGTGAY